MSIEKYSTKRKVIKKIFKFNTGLEVTIDALREIRVSELKASGGMNKDDIGKTIGMNPKYLFFVMPTLSEMGDVDFKLDKNTMFYFIPKECLLQNIFHPKPNFDDKVLSSVKYRFK
jgi:hypothetical protein